MAKKKRKDKSIDEYDLGEARIRQVRGSQEHIGDGLHRLTAWARRSVAGVDQYGRKVKR